MPVGRSAAKRAARRSSSSVAAGAMPRISTVGRSTGAASMHGYGSIVTGVPIHSIPAPTIRMGSGWNRSPLPPGNTPFGPPRPSNRKLRSSRFASRFARKATYESHPSQRLSGIVYNHGGKILGGTAAGVMGHGIISNRSGRAVDKSVGRPTGPYMY